MGLPWRLTREECPVSSIGSTFAASEKNPMRNHPVTLHAGQVLLTGNPGC